MPLFAYGKCLERNQRVFGDCRRYEIPFIGCIRKAGNMNLMALTPIELRRPHYTNAWWKDWKIYSSWIKRRDSFLEEHPDWFGTEDIHIMSPKQLYNFTKKNKAWLDRGDVKPHSTFSFPQRYYEYVPKKDRYIAQDNN